MRKVSIIVATYNCAERLWAVLGHIGRARIPAGWSVEVIVADNGSSDHTSRVLDDVCAADPRFRQVYEPRRGKCAAVNSALREAHGDVILFTDDDVQVLPNWIEGMCSPIFAGEADAVQGAVLISGRLERPWLKGALRTWVASVNGPVAPEGLLVGANMAIKRMALEAVGPDPFDERLGPGAAGYYEDTVVGRRLDALGYRIVYRPWVAVVHHFNAARLTKAGIMEAARKMARSRVVAEPGPALGVRALVRQLPGFVVKGALQLLRRDPDEGFMVRYYRLAYWRARRVV